MADQWDVPQENDEIDDDRESQCIVLTDENGDEHEFEILDVINVDDRDYAILSEGDEDEAIALRVEKEEDGSEVLVNIEDDEEWQTVADAWNALQEEDDWDDWEDEAGEQDD